ncbi:hypothetical protein KJ780_00345 [Candidatus Micrarchaeota archaeon]|nr:hypothetical protein [Candidatus Micrarchaeota archaeon]
MMNGDQSRRSGFSDDDLTNLARSAKDESVRVAATIQLFKRITERVEKLPTDKKAEEYKKLLFARYPLSVTKLLASEFLKLLSTGSLKGIVNHQILYNPPGKRTGFEPYTDFSAYGEWFHEFVGLEYANRCMDIPDLDVGHARLYKIILYGERQQRVPRKVLDHVVALLIDIPKYMYEMMYEDRLPTDIRIRAVEKVIAQHNGDVDKLRKLLSDVDTMIPRIPKKGIEMIRYAWLDAKKARTSSLESLFIRQPGANLRTDLPDSPRKWIKPPTDALGNLRPLHPLRNRLSRIRL